MADVLTIGNAFSIATDGDLTIVVTGDEVYPDPSDVALGMVYGPNGDDFTGTLVLRPIITADGGRATSIVSAIHALLRVDALLITRLATYDFGDGLAPAIFTIDPAPENCAAPLIEISQDLGTSGSGNRLERAVNVGGTVTTWGEHTTSGIELEAIGWDIWRILERGEITTEQFGEILLSAGAPQKTIDPDGYPGRIVNWSASAHETL